MSDDLENMREDFSPLLDGELPPDRRAALEAQLAESADALRELEELKRVDDLFRALPRHAAPPELEMGVHAAIVSRPSLPRTIALRKAYWLWPGLAVAAMALVVSSVYLFTSPQQEGAFLSASRDLARRNEMAESAPAGEADAARGGVAMQYSKGQANANQPAPPPSATVAGPASPAPPAVGAPAKVSPAQAEPSRAVPKAPATTPPGSVPIKKEEAKQQPAEQKTDVELRQQKSKDDAARTMLGVSSAEVVQEVAVAERGAEKQRSQPMTTPMPSGGASARAAMADTAKPAKEATESVGGALRPAVTENTTPTQAPVVNRSDTSGRVFSLSKGMWVEQGYSGQAVVRVERDSSTVRDLTVHDEGLRKLLETVDAPVILYARATWYRVEAKSAQAQP